MTYRATVFVALFFSSLVQAQKLSIATEEFAPLSYTENGKIKGLATEQVELILNGAGVGYSMQVYPWARAYKNALTNNNTCVFTTSNTPERASKFKWVEPLALNRSVLVKLTDSSIELEALEDAKQYRIGVQNEDAGGDKLKSLGFAKLDVARNVEQTLKKLKGSRIQLMAMAESSLKEMQRKGEPIEWAADIFSLKMGLACNPSVSDATIAKLQTELDKIISNGTQAKIAARYEN